MTPLVDDVDVEDHLYFARPLQRFDCFAGRQVLAQCENVRVHDAASSLVRILEEVLDLARLLAPHQLQHRSGQLLWKIPDERGRVVGGKLLKQTRQIVRGVFDQQRGPDLGVDLGERLHREAAVVP